MAKKRYIPMVETHKRDRREQWAEGRDGHSLSSSGRWTDGKLYSNKKEAEKAAKRIADGFSRDENAEPFVRTVEFKSEQKSRSNPFAGADDIYVTKNKIAVTRSKNTKAKRGFTKTTQTKYYEQNDSNLKLLKAAQGDTVRVGHKGKGFKKL